MAARAPSAWPPRRRAFACAASWDSEFLGFRDRASREAGRPEDASPPVAHIKGWLISAGQGRGAGGSMGAGAGIGGGGGVSAPRNRPLMYGMAEATGGS